MKILFSGGGTLGPVTPLIAMQDVFESEIEGVKVVWVVTKHGPEKSLLEKKHHAVIAVTSGKLNRFFTVKNLFTPFLLFAGFIQSVYVLWKEDPDICISAGGYVSVPLHIAAWLFGIPTWVHQQDVTPGVSNKIMAKFAKRVTTALEQSVEKFSTKKTVWLGNPVRKDILKGNAHRARKLFNITSNLPMVFVTGGGTGSLRVNQMIVEAARHLQGVCEIIHLSGQDRPQEMVQRADASLPGYSVYQFFTHEMKDAYALADIIVSRGGFGTLTEISALKKPAIIIPKPGHQQANVQYLVDAGAIVALDEEKDTGNSLAHQIKILLTDTRKAQMMGRELQNVLPIAEDKRLVQILQEIVKKKKRK